MRCKDCGSALIVHGDCITCDEPLGSAVHEVPISIAEVRPAALSLDEDIVPQLAAAPRHRSPREGTPQATGLVSSAIE
jgi:hypothetical protein